jgi:hypothetical protein
MEEWLTDKRLGTQTGLLLVLGLIVIIFAAIGVAATQPLGPLTFFLVLAIVSALSAIGLIAYQLFGLAHSRYALDRNMLTIEWGPIRQVVPTDAIQRILLGTEIAGELRRFRGWRWPGLMHGQADVPEVGLTLFYAPAPLKNQLIVITPTLSYAIAPADPAGFIDSIKARYKLGPTQAVAQTTQRPPLFDWPLWRDRWALGFGALALALALGLFAFVCFRFPELPARLPLHYTVDGLADRVGAASEVFILPLIGLLALLINGLFGVAAYSRERLASYVVWGGTLLVQLLLWVGAFNLLRV